MNNPAVKIFDYWDTFYLCKVERDKFCEDAVTEHMLVHLASGEMELIAPDRRYHLKKGDTFFVARNHLMKKVKRPGKDGEPFRGLFLMLKTPMLKHMQASGLVQLPPANAKMPTPSPYTMLGDHPFLRGLFLSLDQMFNTDDHPSRALMDLKLHEAVLTVLQLKPQLAPVLFNFTGPWKVSLEEFMNKNYQCDLSVEELAHYTGRSLSTFKKEFAQVFQATPSRWVVKRRLQAARELMERTGASASDVYLQVGFKNLSHFSTAFKREFGMAPSALTPAV